MAARNLFTASGFRFALIYLAVFGLSIVTVMAVLYWSTVGVVRQQIDQTIAAEIDGLVDQFRSRGTVGLARAVERRLTNARADRGLYLLADQRFRPIVGNLNRWPTPPPSDAQWATFPLEYADARDRDYGRAHIVVLPGPAYLLVGRDIRELTELTDRLIRGFIWSMAVALTLAILGGLLTSHLMLRRLAAINQTAAEIISGDLSRRVPVSGRDDEFDDLARQVNRMLARIESLLTGLRQVSNDIAHDLRTPLTRLRNRLDQTTRSLPTTTGDNGRDTGGALLLQQCIDDADQLLQTFQALLRIAEVESGAGRERFQEINLAEMLPDLRELYDPVAEERGVTIHSQVEDAVSVMGDRHILFQAIANLLDNAIKFSPDGGAVNIVLSSRDNWAEIGILDRGPGIPPEFRDKAVERFQRLDSSRHAPGNGLGLALVKAAATLHDGELRLDDRQPGLAAMLVLRRVFEK